MCYGRQILNDGVEYATELCLDYFFVCWGYNCVCHFRNESTYTHHDRIGTSPQISDARPVLLIPVMDVPSDGVIVQESRFEYVISSPNLVDRRQYQPLSIYLQLTSPRYCASLTVISLIQISPLTLLSKYSTIPRHLLAYKPSPLTSIPHPRFISPCTSIASRTADIPSRQQERSFVTLAI